MSMILPVHHTLKVFGTDSFELSLGWKDAAGNYYDLTGFTGHMYFYTSKTDRTLLKTVTNGSTGSRIVFASVFPNIYVRIIDTETQIGSGSDFASAPGYYVLDVSPADAEITNRLMEGRVNYEL